MPTLLGFDLGTSSIKASLLDADSGSLLASASSPTDEMRVAAPQAGWAEQDPADWWEHCRRAVRELRATRAEAVDAIAAIGISYQMHGLVCVDAEGAVLRPAIIWCDSRAVSIGEAAAEGIGRDRCLRHFLNSPGNFTASKLKWVKEHEPEIYARIATIMLPGDWLAARLCGRATTTVSGLSEGILWDFPAGAPAQLLLDYYGIDAGLLAETVPSFGEQGRVSPAAAAELGIPSGVSISYRGGDQPNNALSLKVLEPGELAATAGTSGVIYGVSELASADPQSRVNTFVHVNHRPAQPRYGVLLCINGTGCCYSWLKREIATVAGAGLGYQQLNELAAATDLGAAGLRVLPYGNGAERTLGNRDVQAAIVGLDYNRHHRGHLLRAAQEGIVFSMRYGVEAMAAAGVSVSTVRAGQANLFLSPLFAQTFADVLGAQVELYDTDGAQGAARGAGLGAGIYADVGEAFASLRCRQRLQPDAGRQAAYAEIYGQWTDLLEARLQQV